jgi:arylsulfatase A-like enzyme
MQSASPVEPPLPELGDRDDYNLLIFSHSALNRERLSFYGGDGSADPEARCHLRHGLVFDRHFSVSHWPFQSFVSAITGLLPITHGVWNNRYHNRTLYGTAAPGDDAIRPEHRTLFELARDNGYGTFLMAGDPHESFFDPRAGVDRGVDHHERRCLHDRGDGERLRELIREFAERRFLGVVQTVRTHVPHFFLPETGVPVYDGLLPTTAEEYEARARGGHAAIERALAADPELLAADELARQAYVRDAHWYVHVARRLDGPPGAAHFRAVYDRALRFADAFVGDLFRALAETDLLSRTIVMLTADTGDNHFTEYRRPDGRGYDGSFGYAMVTPASARLPLVIFHPAFAAAQTGLRRRETLTNTTDLYPTVARLLGWRRGPLHALDGRDLLADGPARAETLSFTVRPHRGLELVAHAADGTYRENPRRRIFFDARTNRAWVDEDLRELRTPTYLALRDALLPYRDRASEFESLRQKIGWATLK